MRSPRRAVPEKSPIQVHAVKRGSRDPQDSRFRFRHIENGPESNEKVLLRRTSFGPDGFGALKLDRFGDG